MQFNRRPFADDGPVLRCGIAACELGHVLVAASERGVRALFLGDDPDRLTRDLHARFPPTTFVAGDTAFERWLAEAVALVERPARGGTLPLDLRGTPFQCRVWAALRQIPPGTTASYRALAERIDRPTAARAVAQACGANPVAVAVPCHRVVRGDGSLSGYRWGVARKAELLRRERETE